MVEAQPSAALAATPDKRIGIPMVKINTGQATPVTVDNMNDESYEETMMNPEGFFNDDAEQVSASNLHSRSPTHLILRDDTI